ncbi:MAG TPA: SDR family oxidoreductase [Cyclobacteriaceae bacterium]|nr:SDR family oxidoreductase [Cyclobacteriaceae bacterium]
MDRNIIVTGATGNLGRAVIEKFKREGFKVIATVRPGGKEEVEEADDTYELDVTDEASVEAFAKEYAYQYGEIEAMALLVGGYAYGELASTSADQLTEMIRLNFLSTFIMTRHFLPLMKKADKGSILLIGAKPALDAKQGKSAMAYTLSKGLIMQFAELLSEEVARTRIRAHVFVPSVIDTPENRQAMPDQDYRKWVSAAEIAEAMHYAASNPALKNTVFKLYGGL